MTQSTLPSITYFANCSATVKAITDKFYILHLRAIVFALVSKQVENEIRLSLIIKKHRGIGYHASAH